MIDFVRRVLTQLGVLSGYPIAFLVVFAFMGRVDFVRARDLRLARGRDHRCLDHDALHSAGRAPRYAINSSKAR